MTSMSVPTRRCEPPRADRLLRRHEAVPAFFFQLLGHGVRQRVRGRVVHGLVAEAADAVELGLLEPVEQRLEILLGLAGEADDERRADRELGHGFAPLADALQRLRFGRRAASSPSGSSGSRAGTARRDTAAPCRRPSAESARRRADTDRRSASAPTRRARRAPAARSVMRAATSRPRHADSVYLHVDAVRARVLRDHEQLAHAGAHEPLGFAEHVARGAADEVAAQARDDAEAAAVIAAFGDLQVRVVARRELHALRRHEIDERIVRRRRSPRARP